MSKYPYFLRPMALPSAILLGVALTMTARTPVLGRETARLDGFTQADRPAKGDGVNVFALTLKPLAGHPALRVAADERRDVVILVSTAASQTGDYRAKSLATLQSLLAKLGPNDRVKLVAFDLNATSLTQGFVASNSAEMARALGTLNRRTPLGSCDLERALDMAAKSFAGESKSARAVVYIGDGSSRANAFSIDQLDRVVNDLLAQRAPVIAFGVGLQIQEQVLGTLASRTGGVVVPEQATVDAGAYGTRLAGAVHASVLWPKAGSDVKWPAGMDVYPKTFPPLRSDRDTVLVGTAKSTAGTQVEIEVVGPAGAQTLAWDIPALKSDANNSYLVALVDQAKSDGGRTLPLVDSASLATAKQEIEAGGRGLAYFAGEALRGGNVESADKLAGEALSRNPNDMAARAIKGAIAKKAAARPAAGKAANAPVAEAGDLNLQGNGEVLPPDGAAAMKAINESTALEEQWQKDVQGAINKARSQVMVDPGAAETMLQNETNNLTDASELRPEMRERLMGQLRAASRAIRRRKELFIHQEQQRIRDEAARREMEMTNAALAQDQNKVKQLMERFDSLMAEGRHRLAEESAAFEAERIGHRSLLGSGPTTGSDFARFRGAYEDSMAVRVARQKGFVDSVFQTERSHVPVPDDPPIVYSGAEAWKELTARRTEKYSAMELSRRTPAEKKIETALKQPTQIEFVETPLKDVVDYLKDLHGIEIQLDGPALKEAGVDESTPVTKNLKGISLHSALKLLLDELQLKYVIHNEVLLITSPGKAESDEYMTTKVYPVPDLVLPIKQAGFTGAFGGLGNNTMGSSSMSGSSQFGPGNGNPMPNGNPMQNGNPFGGGNQPMGNNLFNIPREILPHGNQGP